MFLLERKAFTAGAARAGSQRRPLSSAPTRVRPVSIARKAILNVDGSETTADESPAPQEAGLSKMDMEGLHLAQLDAAQEQLLSWVLNNDEEQQEEDLDEMVDYDEFDDDEYADIYGEVQQMIEASQSAELRTGDRVVGTVYELSDDGAYVEIGQKASGFVPLQECSFAKLKTPYEVLRVGMAREFVVVQPFDEFGQTVLSLAAMEASFFWERTRHLQMEDIPVQVRVDSANNGGLLVKYGPYDGFVPVSQFGPSLQADMKDSVIGKDISVKFLEIDEERERLVFSHRRADSTDAGSANQYEIGDVAEGVVTAVKPYGAFVELAGITGLLHVSQITHSRIVNVDKVFSEGDRLKVMVLSYDREKGRMTLTTKKLEPAPGDMLRDPQRVFEQADAMSAAFKDRMAKVGITAAVGMESLSSMDEVSGGAVVEDYTQ